MHSDDDVSTIFDEVSTVSISTVMTECEEENVFENILEKGDEDDTGSGEDQGYGGGDTAADNSESVSGVGEVVETRGRGRPRGKKGTGGKVRRKRRRARARVRAPHRHGRKVGKKVPKRKRGRPVKCKTIKKRRRTKPYSKRR